MLKKITKWETEDGKVFDTQEEAEDYMFEQEKEVMTRTTEQERFEAWYEENIGDENKPVREAAFSAWQASRRAPAAPVPQGWKLVPVEATQEMIEAWGNATELPEGMVERSDDEVNAYAAKRDWKAMLAVAPAVVVPDGWKLAIGLCELVECDNSGDSDFERGGMRTAAKRIRKELGAAASHPPETAPMKKE